MIYGIDKDFQQLMELVYGPHYGLGKRVEEESARIAKELVDNAVEEVKKMTDNKQPPDTIEIYGVKYKRIEEQQSFYDKLWQLLNSKIGDNVECDEMADRVRDLIREHIPEPKKGPGLPDYSIGFNEAIRQVNLRLFNDIQQRN